MLTDEEFHKKWRAISKKGRKFIVRYIENGLDSKEAAIFAGFHGSYIITPSRIIRKYNNLINYLLKKNNIIDTFVKPEFVLSQYKRLYDTTQSEITKINILNQLSKILAMINTQPQVNIENNLPVTPITIKFEENE